nr:hypothetical protein [Tanacetum cinerariifolium]
GESLESYYSRFYKMMNELIRNQCKVINHQVNVRFLLQLQPEWKRSQQAATRNRGKATVNTLQSIYDQEPSMVDEDDEKSNDKEIDKLMALISLSFKKIYKPTNNNLRTSSNTSRTNQDNSPRINRNAGYENQRNGTVVGARETVGSTVVQKYGIQCYNCKEFGHVARECQKPKRAKDAAYHREKMLLCKQEEAGIQLNAEQADWRDDTDGELEDQELEAHYMYMAQLQQVSPDAADSGPIFDDEPLQKVSNDDHYNVFAMESTHPEQSKSVCDTYPIEQDAQNVTIDSLEMIYDREEIDQNDDDNDLAKERELLASLIEKLKCEIDESKNHNKFLETSNKALIENLKGEIEDFKNKNKCLESSNNFFKEANNRLSETNNLLYADYKKSEAELARRNSKEYASQMKLDCAKVRGNLLSYKMDYQKSCTKYTDTINALNQTISKMKYKLSAHQETISILSKQKEAQIKLYKTQEDKELDKVIELENKVKVFPDVDDSRPIFDKEPEQKVQNDDHYDVFTIECQHTELSESVHNTYLLEQDAQNVSIESVDMNYDSEQIDQNDEDIDLAKERELLASLIAKLKCEIDESKNRNTLLETSNKVFVEKLKSEITDFKNKQKQTTNCLR